MMTRAHESFAFLAGRLDRYPDSLGSSASPLDGEGGWNATFEVRLPVFEGGVPKLPEHASSTQIGRLELGCTRADGRSTVRVDRTLVHGMEVRHHHRATIQCAKDALSSLESWSQEVSLEGASTPIASEESWTLADWRRAKGAADGPPVTSNWTLMDALQRWPTEARVSERGFEMLEDLELRYRAQRLDPMPRTTLEIGGRRTELRGFRQMGHGVPPRFYWLSTGGRLLFVLDSIWALVPAETT